MSSKQPKGRGAKTGSYVSKSPSTRRNVSKSAAVVAYLRRVQSMVPDKVLSKRIHEVSKTQPANG